MLDILTNPVTLSVIVMCVLCLFKLNVVISLIIAACVAGFTSGMDLSEVFSYIIGGLNKNGENALAYLLLGTFAAALADTGLATLLAKKITGLVKDRKWVILAIALL